MSYSVEVGDTTVWSPALRVGDLYIRMLEDVATVLDLPSGITAIASDMCDIDPLAFERLVRVMFAVYFSTTHRVLTGLLGGVLAPSIVLLDRMGSPIEPNSPAEREFLVRARDLSMPHSPTWA